MKRPYLILTGLFCFVFAYLIFTEVYDRYSATFGLYEDVGARKATVRDPALLKHKLKLLTAERDSLSKRILSARRGYQQNEIGVIQCVTDNARKDRVVVKGISPGKGVSLGQLKEFDFSLALSARFSQVGLLINGLENETIPFEVSSVEMISDPIGKPALKTTLQARAFLYDGTP